MNSFLCHSKFTYNLFTPLSISNKQICNKQPHKKKANIISKEMSDYIKKSNEESIDRIVKYNKKIIDFYPRKDEEQEDLNLLIHEKLRKIMDSYNNPKVPFFSLPSIYENRYLRNRFFYKNKCYYPYLGLFTGGFLLFFLSWKRENNLDKKEDRF